MLVTSGVVRSSVIATFLQVELPMREAAGRESCCVITILPVYASAYILAALPGELCRLAANMTVYQRNQAAYSGAVQADTGYQALATSGGNFPPGNASRKLFRQVVPNWRHSDALLYGSP